MSLDAYIIDFDGYLVFVQVKFKKYLIFTAVIDTNYGKTTRIPNIPETGTLLKHGTPEIKKILF
jgi:hypothetical protein